VPRVDVYCFARVSVRFPLKRTFRGQTASSRDDFIGNERRRRWRSGVPNGVSARVRSPGKWFLIEIKWINVAIGEAGNFYRVLVTFSNLTRDLSKRGGEGSLREMIFFRAHREERRSERDSRVPCRAREKDRERELCRRSRGILLHLATWTRHLVTHRFTHSWPFYCAPSAALISLPLLSRCRSLSAFTASLARLINDT